MKPVVCLTMLSLAANVALAAWWLKGRSEPAPTATVAAESGRNSRQASQGIRFAPSGFGDASAAPPAASTSTNAPSWAQLQTGDLKEFVRRLRTSGCPGETVQDIILAEVNRRYAALNRELWPEQNVVKPFWEVQKNDPADYKRSRERSRKNRELQKEKSALLVELLGVDPEKEQRKAEGQTDYVDYYERRVSFLPEEKREAVTRLLDELDLKSQEMSDRNRGLYDAQYRAERAALETGRLQALAQVLTPRELREYELRQTQVASQLRSDLRSATVSREDYEAIYDIRKKYGDSIYNYAELEGKEAREQATRNREAMEAELANALGPDKARQLKRSQDYAYNELNRLAQRNDLPADTAGKVYDFKEAAEAAAKQLKADTSLTSEQRQQALAEIRNAAQQSVQETLGTHYNTYQRRNGWWLNNIAPAPRTPR